MDSEKDGVQFEDDEIVRSPWVAPPMETWVHDVGEWLRRRYSRFDSKQSEYFSTGISLNKLHTIHMKEKRK